MIIGRKHSATLLFRVENRQNYLIPNRKNITKNSSEKREAF